MILRQLLRFRAVLPLLDEYEIGAQIVHDRHFCRTADWHPPERIVFARLCGTGELVLLFDLLLYDFVNELFVVFIAVLCLRK